MAVYVYYLDSSDVSSDEGQQQLTNERADDDEIPVYLWKPEHNEQLAEWEKHTKVRHFLN